MAKRTEIQMVMALRMRTANFPDDIIEDLIGVKLPAMLSPEVDEILDELVAETESLGLYDDDSTQEEIAVEA